jgi:hypothetical protein
MKLKVFGPDESQKAERGLYVDLWRSGLNSSAATGQNRCFEGLKTAYSIF